MPPAPLPLPRASLPANPLKTLGFPPLPSPLATLLPSPSLRNNVTPGVVKPEAGVGYGGL